MRFSSLKIPRYFLISDVLGQNDRLLTYPILYILTPYRYLHVLHVGLVEVIHGSINTDMYPCPRAHAIRSVRIQPHGASRDPHEWTPNNRLQDLPVPGTVPEVGPTGCLTRPRSFQSNMRPTEHRHGTRCTYRYMDNKKIMPNRYYCSLFLSALLGRRIEGDRVVLRSSS